MKEHIRPKQASQLTKYEFYSLYPPDGLVDREDWSHYHHKKVTVGFLINYLNGKGVITSITFKDCKPTLKISYQSQEYSFNSSDLCDVLWEATLLVVKREFNARKLKFNRVDKRRNQEYARITRGRDS